MPGTRIASSSSTAGIGGRWVNAAGSVLELELHDDGRVTGTLRLAGDGAAYRPHALAGRLQLRPDGTQGVVGSAPGWPTASTVTVWCGELDAAEGTLDTHWLAPIGPESDPGWAGPLGGPVFHRHSRQSRQARHDRRSA